MDKVFVVSILAISLSIQFASSAHAFGVETADVTSALTPQVATSSLNEGFDSISTLTGSGWAFQNNSTPAPLTPTATANWAQGSTVLFTAQSGPANSFIAVGPDSTSGDPLTGVGAVNNWLVTPELDFSQGGTFSFYTRTVSGQGTTYSQYLEVRQSNNGSSTNVGSTTSDFGDFSTLNTTVGSLDSSVAYPGNFAPNTFGLVSFTIAPTAGTGRLAFRYFAPDGGLNGTQGGNIGIDTVSYVAAPEPDIASGFSSTMVLGGFAIAGRLRRKFKMLMSKSAIS
jgi:hypothetical protein